MSYYFKQLGVDEVIFSIMENVGRMKGKTTGLAVQSPDILAEIIDSICISNLKISHNLKSLIQPVQFNLNTHFKVTCPGADRFLFINSLGVVSPCTWVSERAPQYIGESLHHKSLSDILISNTFEDFKEFKKTSGPVCPMETIKK